jgi:glyoxylase-like metal-dependent hydrolase (beta-lactamase superfamily II)
LPWLEDFAKRFERDANYYERFYQENGVPQHIISAIDLVRKNVSLFVDPFRGKTNVFAEGDTIAFANKDWQVFHTPGHAGGLICLWEKESRTLLCNDHLLRDVSSNAIMEPPASAHEPRPKRLVEYLHHLHRMAELKPQLALPGHGAVISNFHELVGERVAFHHLRAQTILDILDKRALSLWELTQALFPALSNSVDWFLGLSEVQGHLDWLEQEEKIKMIQNHSLLWRRP